MHHEPLYMNRKRVYNVVLEGDKTPRKQNWTSQKSRTGTMFCRLWEQFKRAQLFSCRTFRLLYAHKHQRGESLTAAQVMIICCYDHFDEKRIGCRVDPEGKKIPKAYSGHNFIRTDPNYANC